jgi:hypothetical protein
VLIHFAISFRNLETGFWKNYECCVAVDEALHIALSVDLDGLHDRLYIST